MLKTLQVVIRCLLTLKTDLVYAFVLDVCHVAKHGENYKTSQKAGQTVNAARQDGVSENTKRHSILILEDIKNNLRNKIRFSV